MIPPVVYYEAFCFAIGGACLLVYLALVWWTRRYGR